MYAAFAAAARRGAAEQATTGADSGASNEISSSLLCAAFFVAVAFFGGAFDVLPDAWRVVAVVALDDATAGFFPKKSVSHRRLGHGFVFSAGFIFASPSLSSPSALLHI
jgi:hypothetical protein